MLRMVANSSSAAAKRYFTESLDRGDYYARGQELPGRWGGLGASRLRLEGEVRQGDFNALCENRNPDAGGPLTLRTKDNRRVGYDINFHCPKSVSVVYALTGDRAILEAFQASVRETMEQLERGMECRVRKQGAQLDRRTGNLIWAEFVHQTARPVDGVSDPHLHAHCFTFNATWDQEESQWKAGQFGGVKRDAPLFEACFHGRLSQRLAEAGYAVERRGRSWELAGVSTPVLDAFSRRTAEIEELAERLAITDPHQKGTLGARTRQSKQKDASPAALLANWEARVSKGELAALRKLKGKSRTLSVAEGERAAEQAVAFAMEHGFERRSVLREQDLYLFAMREALGKASPEQVKAAVDRATLVRHQENGESLITTKEVLKEETQMLDFAREGRGACRAFLSAPHAFRDQRLGDQQRQAVEHVLHSTDRVTIVRGGAGTGKTSLMRETVTAIEAGGKGVVTLAPSAEASRGVLRSEGFDGAETVEKFLQDKKLLAAARGKVLWVDEAGLLGTRTMGRLFDAAKKQGCRVVLSGDWRQHRGVERGGALRLLEHEAGVRPAEITEIQRQRGLYRSAIEHLSAGRMERGFEGLFRLGSIREASEGDAHRFIAGDYVTAKRIGKSALVVCPTHEEGRLATAAIRRELRDAGLLDAKTRKLEQLVSKGWTQAEKEDASRYEKGLVLRFHKAARGFRAGERTTVVGVDKLGNVWVQGKLGPCILARHQAERFDVFESRNLEVSRGDLVRFTRNGRTADHRHAINNGAVYEVKGFTLKGELKLANGWVVPKDFGHFTHGYCVTSHASQGRTVDRVFVAQSRRSFGATSAEQFYVSASRGRESCTIYTDDVDGLRAKVCAAETAESATALAKVASTERKAVRGRNGHLPTGRTMDEVRKTNKLRGEDRER